ncbi:MAG: acyltransferase [Methanomicrobiales archaeon]|nr:acyltransferase [Methanomicrobiales archaeon]
MVWFDEVGYLRGFAALAVIAVHVSMNYIRIPVVNLLALTNAFIYVAAHFAVPVFLFISGWVLAARYTGDFSLREFYRRRAWRVIPPYLFFTALYLLVRVDGTIGFAGIPSLERAASALLLGTAAYHLWFFALIIQIYLLFPLIVRGYDIFDRAGAALYLLFSLFFLMILWNTGAHLIGAFAGAEWYTVLIRLIPSHLFYVAAGIHVARHPGVLSSLSPAWVLAAAGAGALLSGGVWVAAILVSGSLTATSLAIFCIYRIFEPFYCVPAIAALVLAARRLDAGGGRASEAVLSFGEYSYGIYLIHPLVIAAGASLWFALTGLLWADWVTYPVIFVVAVLASYAAVRVLSHVPYARWVLGVRG